MSQLIHNEFSYAKELIFKPCGFECSEPIAEKESGEYGACIFKLNGTHVRFRVAKITPTKTGQFVTFWKRVKNGTIQPYDTSDDTDIFIIVTRTHDNVGQFIFPKNILSKHDIISNNHQGGKRAIRVYPPWDITTSFQAKRTQAWQLEYFLETAKDKQVDHSRAKILYGLGGI